MRNRLSYETDTVHDKDTFGEYLEYYWGIDSHKNK